MGSTMRRRNWSESATKSESCVLSGCLSTGGRRMSPSKAQGESDGGRPRSERLSELRAAAESAGFNPLAGAEGSHDLHLPCIMLHLCNH